MTTDFMTESARKRIGALIVAGGSGSRARCDLPKQYVTIGGMPILRHAVTVFAAHPRIAEVAVVIQPEHRERYDNAVKGLVLLPPIPGGATRQKSVRNGLEAVAAESFDSILIHDAARPFVTEAVISRVIDALERGEKAVLPVVPVHDTVKRMHQGHVLETLSRDGLGLAQTPQGFDFATILSLHRQAGEAATDDTALAEQAGIPVITVEGEAANIKLTTKEEIRQAERQMATRAEIMETCVGQGFDVHRFVPFAEGVPEGERGIMLCGVSIPHDQAVEGHSDADAGLHALTDAILGALAEGDIGSHFPPNEARWKDADSELFLKHAAKHVAKRQGRIVHADITIICEVPKVGLHRQAMRKRIATILEIELERVSVKATTTERLGFAGRKEGIAAQAIATLELPAVTSSQKLFL